MPLLFHILNPEHGKSYTFLLILLNGYSFTSNIKQADQQAPNLSQPPISTPTAVVESMNKGTTVDASQKHSHSDIEAADDFERISKHQPGAEIEMNSMIPTDANKERSLMVVGQPKNISAEEGDNNYRNKLRSSTRHKRNAACCAADQPPADLQALIDQVVDIFPDIPRSVVLVALKSNRWQVSQTANELTDANTVKFYTKRAEETDTPGEDDADDESN